MMRSSFDSQLRQLNNELIEMGALCEEAITLSAKALAEGSAKIAGGLHRSITKLTKWNAI